MEFKKFIPCRKCNNTHGGRIPLGFYFEEVVHNYQKYKIVKECEHHKIWKKEYEAFLDFKKSGFDENWFYYDPATYVGDTSKENLTRLSNYIADFKKFKSVILYFYGKSGNQKTVVANWIAAEIIKQGFTCKYLSFEELNKLAYEDSYKIANLFSNKQEEPTELSIINKADLLILDNMFDENKLRGNGAIGPLDAFIRNRIKENKGIIFISKKSISSICDSDKSPFWSLKEIIEVHTKRNDTTFGFFDNYLSNNFAPPQRLF